MYCFCRRERAETAEMDGMDETAEKSSRPPCYVLFRVVKSNVVRKDADMDVIGWNVCQLPDVGFVFGRRLCRGQRFRLLTRDMVSSAVHNSYCELAFSFLLLEVNVFGGSVVDSDPSAPGDVGCVVDSDRLLVLGPANVQVSDTLQFVHGRPHGVLNMSTEYIGIGRSPVRLSFFNGVLHSYDKAPAYDDSIEKRWYHHGVLHNDGGPVLVDNTGLVKFARHGLLHSFNDEPSVTLPDGTREWHRDGRLHRDNDKPAIIKADGTLEWLKDGYWHRDDDKPAVMNTSTGLCEWWYEGKLHRDSDQYAIINKCGAQWWFNDMRDRHGDKPAVIRFDGSMYWYQHGRLHRGDDKPAAIRADGKMKWYRHGRCHRDKGMAILYKDGSGRWFRDDEEFFPSSDVCAAPKI